MTILVVLWLIAIGLFVLGLKWDNEFYLIVSFGGAAIALFVSISVAVDYADFRPTMSEMAVTRSAVERLGCLASEDVMGKATDMNAEVASNKVWRDRLGSFVPAGWDTVTPIALPECAP